MALSTRLGHGLLAGAAGTIALDATTYADMLIRGRPASRLPGEAAAQMAKRVGVDLQGDDDTAEARRDGLGSLLGYAAGVTVGVAGAFLLGGRRAATGTVLSRGLLLGAGAMAASMVPMTAQGLTDPRRWGVEGWLADIVPHAAYGLAAAAALDVLNRGAG
jgi:hypothetical protein